MCPVCLGNLALLALGVSSSSELTPLVVRKLLKKEINKPEETE